MLISTNPIFLLIKQCKSFQQLQQVHAQCIVRGLISLYPSLLLNKILYTFTTFHNLNNNSSFPSISLYLNYALCVFNQIPLPSTFSYNTIIRLHTIFSSPLSSILLFTKMRRLCIPPDTHTFPFVLKASTRLCNLKIGRTLHTQSLKFGFGSDIFIHNTLINLYLNLSCLIDAYQLFDEMPHQHYDLVSCNVLINMFVKAGDMSRARKIFDDMRLKDVVTWGTLLTGYAQTNQCDKAIEMFEKMHVMGIRPDNVALVSVLSACAQRGALEQGRNIHDYIERNGILVDAFLVTGLVDMYAKCGCIHTARQIFDSSFEKNLFTWNAMVAGLAMNGFGELSLYYFLRMREAGVRPDGVSFLAVLAGCSHVGLVEKAREIFDEMESVYGVQCELKHYGCMVDLLGRAGLIKEALEIIKRMPMEGDVFVWGGLLGGCRIHGNVEVAEIAAQHIMALEPNDSGVYSIMGNIYANAGRWEDVGKMRRLMNDRKVCKNVGCSLIQVDGRTHEFIAGDKLHPKINEIYWILDGIGQQQYEGSS